MQHTSRHNEQRPAWMFWPATVTTQVVSLVFLSLLGIVILGVAAGGPEWIRAWRITAAFLLFAGLLILGRHVSAVATAAERRLSVTVAQLVLLVGLLLVTYQSRTPGFGLGVDRTIEAAVIFAGLIAFCVLAGDPRQYTPVQWLAIGCFATVVGIFFYHSLSIAEVSTRSRHPVWAGFIMAVGLIVLPQYLSREQFLRALAGLAALLVLLTVPIYLVGEYAIFGLRFGFMGAFTLPILGYEVRATRSLFVHRNAFATVMFAGSIAALSEFHRAYAGERAVAAIVGSGVLLTINTLGLLLSYGRALLVITPMAVGLYLAYVAYGRRAIPVAVVGGFAYLAAGIVAVHTGLLGLPENTPTRADRWYPSIAAILDQPSLLGEGLINTGAHIAEYDPEGRANSPHNSYLSIWIRAGIVGGVAYLALVVAGLVRETWQSWDGQVRDADVGVLTLAVGFASHQLFEAYTMFWWGSGSVLAALVFGFLLFGRSSEASPSSELPALSGPTEDA